MQALLLKITLSGNETMLVSYWLDVKIMILVAIFHESAGRLSAAEVYEKAGAGVAHTIPNSEGAA